MTFDGSSCAARTSKRTSWSIRYPLGKQPRGAAARAERALTQQRIEKAQRQLGRAAYRGAQRAASQVLTIG